MRVDQLDKLVVSGQLKSYRFSSEDDTGEDPYQRLELVFPSGFKLAVIPAKKMDGEQSLDLFFVDQDGRYL